MTQDAVRQELMRVAFTLGGRPIDENVAALAAVASDPDGLNRAITDGVGLFAWWSTLEVKATDAEETARDALDALEADILSRSGDEKVTTAKALMKTDARWKRLHAAWREAHQQAEMVKVGRKTTEHRESALREVAMNLRSEMEVFRGVRPRGASPEAFRAEKQMQQQYGKQYGKKVGA